MNTKRTLLACAAVGAMISSSAAFAGEAVRAANAVPATHNAQARAATILGKKKSNLQEVGDAYSAPDGTYVIAGLGLITVIGGIIVAVDKNDDAASSDSPG